MADTTISIRLGRLLYWVACVLAAFLIVFGAFASSMQLYEGRAPGLHPVVGFLVMLIYAAVVWGAGRGLRYLFANE